MNADLHRIASVQKGMFTTKQAASVGVGKKGLRQLTKSGVLVHPIRGLYAVRSLVSFEPAAWQEHLAAGAGLLYDDVVLTGVTVALAHGLPVWGCPLERCELLRPIKRQVSFGPYRLRPLRSLTVDGPGGLQVPLAAAIVQLAMDHGIVQGVVTADAALHQKLLTLEDLDEAVEAVAAWPRSYRARAMRSHVDPKCQSVAESRARVEFASHGIPVVSQVEVRRSHDGSIIGWADFGVEGTDVLIEIDGKLKYADGDPQVLWNEKGREDEMRAAGKVFVRVTWAELDSPGRASAKVRRAMAHQAAA